MTSRFPIISPSERVVRKPRKRPEEAIQRSIVSYLRAVLRKDHRVIAVPNAARRRAGGRAGNGVPGLAKGFPDLLIVGPLGRSYMIECKAEKGRMSVEQNEWKAWFASGGVPYVVARSTDDVKLALAQWRVETREVA